MVFFILTLFCVVYVNAKRWIRPEQKGRLYQAVTIAENYAPILLFVSCLALYVTFSPYGQNFAHYMSGEELVYGFRDLPIDSLPIWSGMRQLLSNSSGQQLIRTRCEETP